MLRLCTCTSLVYRGGWRQRRAAILSSKVQAVAKKYCEDISIRMQRKGELFLDLLQLNVGITMEGRNLSLLIFFICANSRLSWLHVSGISSRLPSLTSIREEEVILSLKITHLFIGTCWNYRFVFLYRSFWVTKNTVCMVRIIRNIWCVAKRQNACNEFKRKISPNIKRWNLSFLTPL
jgi:hypothetical protein